MRYRGGNWVYQEVRDKNWVTSGQPSDIPAVNRAMLELFAEKKKGLEKGTRTAA